ncbi:MAG TPA: hypothetical protein PKH29_12480 [Oscillospiraceae bacterium]|nr:hypothetical protein [Oscillospiraceae bacterium]
MEILVAVLGSGALSALISGVFTVACNRSKKKDGVRAGVRMLLYDKIKHLGNKYSSAGEISEEDLEDLFNMHKIYHDDLAGNGYLDHVMTGVRSLPIKPKAK